MTAQARAADRWRMDTGEQKAVPDDYGERLDAVEKWLEDFVNQHQRMRQDQNEDARNIETLRDLILAIDAKHDLTMSQIRAVSAIATKMERIVDKLDRWADPQIRLQNARAEVEADVLAKAARWRARLEIARPIAFFVLLLAFAAVALWVWVKTGINIVPLVTE